MSRAADKAAATECAKVGLAKGYCWRLFLFRLFFAGTVVF